jgi:glutamate-1-semialdehyde 2,1-aminomutase
MKKKSKKRSNMTKSLEMQERAKRRIPGMTQLLSKRPDRFSYGIWPGYFSKAKGVEIWDLDGNRYLDMSIGGIGANVLGYADQDVDHAVIEAIKCGTSSSLNCYEEVELAEVLCELHPWAEMVRYSRTGGEAMAMAVRIARAYTGRDKVAFCGYHGWHDWYLAANLESDEALTAHLMGGLSPIGVPKGLAGTAFPFRYNRLDDLKVIFDQHKGDLAAVVMEPLRNFNPDPGFLENVRTLVDENGAVLIVDEISAGFRYTTGGAHLVFFKVTPDIAVFSKALGNGYPIAAVIGKSEIMEASQKTFISSTYWTERIGPTAALAVIKKHKKLNVGARLVELGEKVRQGWLDMAQKHNLRIRVQGMKPNSHFIFEYEDPQTLKAYFVQLMLEKGFLASNLFYAMYAHKEEHVEKYLEAVDTAFQEIALSINNGDLKQKLRGRPASIGFRRLN